MLTGLVNRLRGQVHLRVHCPYPERVLNLCSARNLSFWDLEWEEDACFTCRMTRRDSRIFRQAAEKLDCQTEVLRREGVPYALLHLRRRQTLAVSGVACALLVTLGSFFIWDIQITGCKTVSREEVLRALERSGVRRGAFGLTLDGEDIRNHVLLEIPELSWIAVNVSGCRANVEVRERRPVPELLDRRVPGNVVARRDGLVLRIQALGGTPAVLRGTSVTRGQLLISGVEDTGTFGSRITAGLGRVEGRTWYTLTANAPLTVRRRVYTGDAVSVHALIAGTRRIKFYANSSIDRGTCDKITTRTPLRVLGMSLPLTWVTETYRFYRWEEAAMDPQLRQEQVGAALGAYLRELVAPYGEVTAEQVTSRVRGETLTVQLAAECREELGVRVPIYTEEEPGGSPGA